MTIDKANDSHESYVERGYQRGWVVVSLWRPKVQVFFDLRGAVSASWKMRV